MLMDIKESEMSKSINTQAVEKTSLKAHVEMCAERYKQLDERLEIIEVKVNRIEEVLNESKNGLAKVIIGAAGTIVAGIISVILTIITKF